MVQVLTLMRAISIIFTSYGSSFVTVQVLTLMRLLASFLPLMVQVLTLMRSINVTFASYNSSSLMLMTSIDDHSHSTLVARALALDNSQSSMNKFWYYKKALFAWRKAWSASNEHWKHGERKRSLFSGTLNRFIWPNWASSPIFGHVKPFHLTELGFLPCFRAR
jgi:hypothetical protein